MINSNAPFSRHTPDSPDYQPRHAPPPHRRTRGRRSARPFLLAQLNAGTPAAATGTMQPPAPAAAGRHRGFGPWAKQPDDMAELGALTRQLLAQRPDLAHPHPLGIGARTGAAPR
ncbi:hypothetical protein GCM10027570_08430 [Streptomonospora sediminis]